MTAPPDIPSAPAATSALAHELKTPLAAIIGFADAMRERAFGPLSDRYVECAETIDRAARHMLDLVERMTELRSLDHEPERRRFRQFDAVATIGDVQRLLQARADVLGVELVTEVPAVPLTVEADDLGLRQIAINLIANALAATPRGGHVNVVLERRGDEIVITVHDTGPGPTSAAADGLGLTLVRTLCADFGGAFDLTSVPGGGAMAVAQLPILFKG